MVSSRLIATLRNILSSIKPFTKKSLVILILISLFTIFSFVGKGTVKPPKIVKSPSNSLYLYETSNQSFSAKIGNKSSASPFVSFSSPNGTNVTFSLIGSESKSSQQNDNSVVYSNIFPDTDLSYTTLPNGLKEEIILSKPVTKAEYVFNLKTTAHPRPITTEFYSPFFFDDENNYQFHLEKPFAIDAKGNRTDDVLLTLRQLKEDKNTYQIRLTVPEKWLKDKDRAYPIIIDPTIVHDTTTEFAAGVFNRVKDTGSGSVPSLETFYQELPTDSNTLALYHFSNGVCHVDSSGNSYNLTATNGMTCATGGLFGYMASGFAVTPVSYYNDTLMDPAMSSGTIEAWINPTNLTAVKTIFYADSTTDTLLTIGTTGQVNFSTSGSTNLASPARLVAIGVWTHIAATWTPSGHKIYVNGVEADRDINATTHTAQNYVTYIGVGSGGNTLPFIGGIDDLRVTNIARTPEEIRLAALRRPSSVFTSGLVDFTIKTASWNPLSWYEWGVTTGDGETPKDTTSLVAQWNFNSTSGTTATNDAGAGTCGGTASNCDFTLNQFASTGSQDAADLSGWTANNKRWGAGSLMVSSTVPADYLSRADPTGNVLDPNSSNMTIETWINSTDNTDDLLSNNNSNGTACTNTGYYFGIDATGFPVFYLDTNGATAGCDAQIITSTKKINDGIWHHVAVTVTSGSSANLYVDGVLTGSDTTVTSYSAITVSGPIYVGASGQVDVTLDSTRFYSRALTPAEIVSNYQSSNIELQTRIGATTTPDDGTWEAWKPVTSETVIDNLDNPLDYATPSASLYSLALISTSSATFPLVEGTHSLKIQTGQVNSVVNTVALWHFDETGGSGAYIKDSSGNANHGTPTGTSATKGFVSSGRAFNGTSDYISVGALTGGTAVKSIDFWVYPTSATTYFLDLNGTANISINNGTIAVPGFASPATYVNGVSSATVVPNMWQHIAVTTGTGLNASNTVIGKYSTGYMWGKLDEMRIGTLVLSAEEVAETYRAGRDHYINKTISSTDLSGKTTLPFYIAADRPGTYLQATVGESLYANFQPDANTTGFWHLEEPAGAGAYLHDSSGNSRHGTPTLTTFVEGKLGKARNIAASDDISLGSQAMFDSAANLTIDAWIRPNTQTAATQYRAIGEELVVAVGQFGGQAAFRMGNGAAWTVTDTTGGFIPLNQWSYLTWVKSGTSYYIYINGVLNKSGTGAPATLGTTATVNYISTSNGTAEPWRGVIDEMRVSNVARTATEIRQAYEMGQRTHPITIDFASAISHTGPLSSSSDLTFTLMATPSGTANAGDNIFNGDKIIVKENYNGTEYIAQGLVDSVNISSGATTVSSWDASSTFPSVGFTPNASVFKWQRESWNIDGEVLDTSLNAITNLTLRVSDGNEGRNIWLDDLRSSSGYLTTSTGSTITSSTGSRYLQYRAILSSFDEAVSATLSGVTVDYVLNAPPNIPTLDFPADTAGNQSNNPVLKTTATDTNSDYLRYKIEICTNVAMTVGCVTPIDQTSSQTGWSGQDTQTSTAYLSGSQAIFTVQTPLSVNTTYYWRSYAIDPNGANSFGSTQATPYSFTTNIPPNIPTLDAPSDTATNQSRTPILRTTATDNQSDYMRYKIEICTNGAMSAGCQTYDQTISQTGWSGQNADSGAAYTSGTQGVFTVQTPLTDSTTYYWRSYAIDPNGANSFGSTQATPFSFVTSTPPTAPTTPFADGQTNPIGLTNLTPVFSAIHHDPSGDAANKYQIEVNTNNTFTGTVMWDSTQISMTSTADNIRSPDFTYAGTAIPLDGAGTVYYWRIRFTDINGVVGAWSAAQSFTMNSKPVVPALDQPSDTTTGISITPILMTTGTDVESDYLRYKIIICTDQNMTINCQTFDQTISQTGWGDQDTESTTAYLSGSQATYLVQTPLDTNTTYFWKSSAIDPGGSITFGSTQTTAFSFTTLSPPPSASACTVSKNPGNTQIVVSWTDNATSENGYQIWKFTDGGLPALIPPDLAANSVTYTDTAITSGHSYGYLIRSFKLDGSNTLYSNFCTTATSNLSTGSFGLKGLKLGGLKLN